MSASNMYKVVHPFNRPNLYYEVHFFTPHSNTKVLIIYESCEHKRQLVGTAQILHYMHTINSLD